MWTALTTLEERASFLRKMTSGLHTKKYPTTLSIHEKRLKDVEEAAAIRKILLDSEHYSGLRPTEKELDSKTSYVQRDNCLSESDIRFAKISIVHLAKYDQTGIEQLLEVNNEIYML